MFELDDDVGGGGVGAGPTPLPLPSGVTRSDLARSEADSADSSDPIEGGGASSKSTTEPDEIELFAFSADERFSFCWLTEETGRLVSSLDSMRSTSAKTAPTWILTSAQSL